ncbi:MAG TPA: hypothetical protein VLB86_04680 [Gaiellaceae bacterium]|nr:hypothetical protein [Gaiellaceae bacterium]
MTSALLQREAALAAVAVLAVAIALAVAAVAGRDGGEDEASATPVAAGDWYTALVAPYAFEQGAKRTKCGIAIGATTMGVAHPVLPCGAKLVLEFGDVRVLTQVIDRGPASPGHEFDVSRPLAKELKLQGIQPLKWQFAR